MKIQLTYSYTDIISVENLLAAWKEFLRGKKNKKDVQEFSLRLMDNILSLHDELRNFVLIFYLGMLEWGNAKKLCNDIIMFKDSQN